MKPSLLRQDYQYNRELSYHEQQQQEQRLELVKLGTIATAVVMLLGVAFTLYQLL